MPRSLGEAVSGGARRLAWATESATEEITNMANFTIEISDDNIRGALTQPSSSYWAKSCDLEFQNGTFSGYVVESDSGETHVLGDTKLARGIAAFAKLDDREHFGRLLDGSYDGGTGDILLQLIAFGEIKYG